MENDEKVKAFLEEYHALVEKHKIDFASYPMFVPDKGGSFRIVVQNTPVPLPEAPQDAEGVKSPLVM